MRSARLPTLLFWSVATLAAAGLPSPPTEEWRWSGDVWHTPVVVQLTDDNGDGRIDASDDVDVAFLTSEPSPSPVKAYVVLDGATGLEHWRQPNGSHVTVAGLAVGDIDADGFVEFVATNRWGGGSFVRPEIRVSEHDGSLTWSETIGFDEDDQCLPALADLDQDGIVELIASCYYRSGERGGSVWVFRPDGTLAWWQLLGNDCGRPCPPLAADLVPGEPGLEVLTGKSCFAADGRTLWQDREGVNGCAGLGDLDGDGQVEVVDVFEGSISVLRAEDGQLLGATSFLSWHTRAPLLADIDGDGSAEVVVSGDDVMSAYDWDGSALQLKWTVPVVDGSCCMTASAYDFDCDGAAEVLTRDELTWSIIEGADGSVLHREDFPSGTFIEHPQVVELDGDPNPEILVAAIGPDFSPGLRVYEVVGGAPTRRIWNQQGYHGTNVADDGSIPTIEEPAWSRPAGWPGQDSSCGDCIPWMARAMDDARACVGEMASLDATELQLLGCSGSLTYEWRDEGGALVGTESIFESMADETGDFEVTVTCDGRPDCFLQETARILVDQPPLFDGVEVRSLSACSLGLELTWPAATFASGSGTYHVYRAVGAAGDCARALSFGPIAVGLTDTRYFDSATTPGERHVYVVEAEDALGGSTCAETGRSNGGSVARSCAEPIMETGGVAWPQVVGAVLRLRHEGDDVVLSWPAARTLWSGEHFHLLKSAAVQGPFVRANDEAAVAREWTDRDPSASLQFFDLRVANSCEDESFDEFPPSY